MEQVRVRVLGRGSPRLQRLAQTLSLLAGTASSHTAPSISASSDTVSSHTVPSQRSAKGGYHLFLLPLCYNLSTIQREYVALHSVRSLPSVVQKVRAGHSGHAME